MSAGRAKFPARGQRVHVFAYLVFSAGTAAAQIVASVDQDAKRPGDKGRLPAKTGDASLNFQEGFLYGVFGIGLRAEKIAREISHARALPLVETLVALQVSAEAGRRHSRVRRKDQVNEDVDSLPPHKELRAPGAHPSLRMALESALDRLSAHQRDVFLLYEVEGFHHAEIAGMLEISETASKNTLFQAKRNLRTMLEPPRSSGTGAI